jgi:hypothetical protein
MSETWRFKNGLAQRGLLLPFTLGAIVLVNVLLLFLLSVVTTDRKIAYNVIENDQAVLAADAGIAWAVELLAQAAADAYPEGDFFLPGQEVFLAEEVGFRLQSLPEALGEGVYALECEGFCRQARKVYRVILTYQEEAARVEISQYTPLYR